MKTTLILAALFVLSSTAIAGFNAPQQGGFNDNYHSNEVLTIKQAKSRGDDSRVILDGYIERRVKNEDDEFIFRDLQGDDIQIEVKDNAWNGMTVNPGEKIRIYGKLDKEFFGSSSIDVDKIEKLQ